MLQGANTDLFNQPFDPKAHKASVKIYFLYKLSQ